MSEYKSTIRGIVPGDKVRLRMPDVKGLTDAERERRVLIDAEVVAVYPHCIQFRTEFGYMISPNMQQAEEMVSGIEHKGRCPWNEQVQPSGSARIITKRRGLKR